MSEYEWASFAINGVLVSALIRDGANRKAIADAIFDLIADAKTMHRPNAAATLELFERLYLRDTSAKAP
jgi:hypothetical protein